jgi:hypothetical protein
MISMWPKPFAKTLKENHAEEEEQTQKSAAEDLRQALVTGHGEWCGLTDERLEDEKFLNF